MENSNDFVSIPAKEYEFLRTSLENSEKTIKILEVDVNKLRIENIRLEKALKTLQDTLAVCGKVCFSFFFREK